MNQERVINQKNLNLKYEELIKQNEELETRNRELAHLNDELTNQISYINIPIIIVGDDLRICQFTSKAEEILHLDPKAIGRPINDFMKYLNVPNLDDLILDVIKKGSLIEKKVQEYYQHSAE